jgi:hypothetical protein
MLAVKFMAVDDQIAILGNGNQGTGINSGCVHRGKPRESTER